MAYDPKTGKFTDESKTVAQTITGLLDKDNPYMKQAATRGRQAANRRGLLNSSIAVGAVEGERIKAALPIATQDSAQSHERHIQGRNIEFQDIGQQRNIAAQRDLLDTEIAGRKDLQTQDISSRERMQERDIAAARESLERELGSRAMLQEAEIAAQRERLGMQLSSQEERALQELRAAEQRLGLELTSRETMQQRDLELQERIANMNLSANERTAAAQIAQAFESTYAQMVSSIMNNPEMPANERQRMLDHAARIRDSNYSLVEQFYGIDLTWGGGASRQPPGYIPPGFRGGGGSGGLLPVRDEQR